MIKRYDCKLELQGFDRFSAEMEESDNGDYVKFSDVEYLINLANNKELLTFLYKYSTVTQRKALKEAGIGEWDDAGLCVPPGEHLIKPRLEDTEPIELAQKLLASAKLFPRNKPHDWDV